MYYLEMLPDSIRHLPCQHQSLQRQHICGIKSVLQSQSLNSFLNRLTSSGNTCDYNNGYVVPGPLTSQQTDMFMRNQRFSGLKFPDMHRPETLERRFARHLDAEAMSFLT